MKSKTRDNVGFTFVNETHSTREVTLLIKSALESATGEPWLIDDIKFNPSCTIVNLRKPNLNKKASAK